MTIRAPTPTVILIDDDPFQHRVFERTINGCKLLEPLATFLEPRAALEFLCDRRNPAVDVIFLDLQMPAMTGFQFLDTAKASLDWDLEKFLVVILTSSDRSKDIDRAFSYKMVMSYFNKPLTVASVERVIKIWRTSREIMPDSLVDE